MSQAHQFNNRESQTGTSFYNYSDVDTERSVKSARQVVVKERYSKDERITRIFKIIIVLLVFVIFVQISYHLYFARNIMIEKIVIEAGAGFTATDEQVLQMAGLGGVESYFSLKPEQVKTRLERYPQIASVSVEKKFPGTLIIGIEGRTPIAVCLIDNNGETIPAAVDAEGIIFQIGKTVSELNLPVLSGIKIGEAGIGSKMPRPVTGFLHDLEKLRKESPVFYNSISELKFVRKTNEDFEVLMYPQNYSIPVRIGNRIDKNLFTYVILVLDVVKAQGMSAYLEELDFRTDEVVYKIREE
ncbi:MAG: FtsQ-type POTRA domain-containing protein [Spirochaetales bacterium]|nr:FtsQ-type POTRA domain-containing protein [Spirochaetales bacterium]